ncbi:MAG: hypothetical protein RLZZ303_3374 [Candidatus Hydrogenedentota bacterium]|jgi:hypothetical protein
MTGLVRETLRKAVAFAAIAAALFSAGTARAEGEGEGEALFSFCTLDMSGDRLNPPQPNVGSGTVEVLINPSTFAGQLVFTFADVGNVVSVQLLRDNGVAPVLEVDFSGSGATSPFTVDLTPEQVGLVNTIEEEGDRPLFVVTGDVAAIAADASECSEDPDCVIGLTGGAMVPPVDTPATGGVDIFFDQQTGGASLTINATGVNNLVSVGAYRDDEGTLTEVINFADNTATFPLTVDLTPEQVGQLSDIAEVDGDRALIVILSTTDSIAGELLCGGGGEGEGEGVVEGEGEGTLATGFVRLIHGAASFGDVEVCVNGELSQQVSFGTIGAYDESPSDSYTVTIFNLGEGCGGTPIATTELFIADGQYYTVVLADGVTKGGNPTMQVFLNQDDNTATPGVATVRAYNLSPNAGVVDINDDGDALGATPLLNNVTYGGPSASVQVAPQVLTPSVRDEPNANILLTGSPIALGDGGVYSIFLFGLVDGQPALSASSSSEVEGLPVEGEGEGVVEGEGEGTVEGEGEGTAEGEGEGTVEGEGEGTAEGEGEGGGDEPIDFCAIQDEIANIVDDPVIGPVLADLLGEDIGLLSLLGCDVADLNGPLPVLEPEGEEPGLEEQLPGPNGILDGPFELAVLAELINNPGPYAALAGNGGVDASAVGAAFESNLAIALGSLAGVPPEQLAPLFNLLLGDSLPVCGEGEGEAVEGECFTQEEKDEIILRAAELVPNIGLLLAGYITLGDDNSVAVAILVLSFINDAADGILGLGVDPDAYDRLGGILSISGDADGDGCTQESEFQALGENPDSTAYVAAVLDPDTADCPTPIDFCAIQDELAGIVSDPVIGPVLADLLGEDIGILNQLACDVADLNGPLPVLEPEGEEPSIEDQLPDPNGILDGPFELAVVAELINNPGPYAGLAGNGGVDASAVGAAFDANLTIALGSLAGVPPEQLAPLFELLLGDALPVCGEGEGEAVEGECFTQEEKDEIILRAAELVPNIGLLLCGYITLGDDNSVSVATLVLGFINDATDGILGLGTDPDAYTRLDAILSADADADGDGCTQRQEFNGLFAGKGATDTELYVSAVLDPNNAPLNCEAEGEGEEPVLHNADTDGDSKIGLGELLRIIQFYNAGSYTCDETNQEDGYTPGDGGTAIGSGNCEAHDIDFDGTAGSVSLTELLRGIQFFNLDALLNFTGAGEDGWAAIL